MWSKLFVVVLLVHYLSAREINSGLVVPTVTCPVGYKPTCFSVDTDPTDTSKPPGSATEDTDFKTFCINNGDGEFTNKSDPTCKTFIYCLCGRGKAKTCVKINSMETWFDGEKCVLEKPAFCS